MLQLKEGVILQIVGDKKKRKEKQRQLNPFPNDKFLDSSKRKDFADNNLKFEGNEAKVL